MKTKTSIFGASALIYILQSVFAAPFAGAQDSPSTTNEGFTQAQQTTNIAPTYSQNNFRSDARADNLYSYRNPTSQIQQPWNTHQLLLKQLAANVMSPSQSSKNTSNKLTNTHEGFSNVLQEFSGLSKGLLQSQSNSPGLTPKADGLPDQTQPKNLNSAESQARMSVDGELQSPTIQNVPGLVPQ